jgi:hypothetical protein
MGLLACLVAGTATAEAQTLRTCAAKPIGNYGKFASAPKVEFLKPGRNVKLLEDVTYTDPCGSLWTSPKDWVVDGATIPRVAWPIVGAPLDGTYRDASIIHDVACDEKKKPWQLVHDAFYFAMLASGVEPWRAKVMYAAVYHFGPRWRDPETNQDPAVKTLKEKRFKKLAEVIRIRETASSMFERAPMSIEEIQAWAPPR